MLCYRCGSYNADGSKKCTVCSAALASPRRPGKAAPSGRRAVRGKLPVEAGTIIGGRYRVVDGIAQGSAGWVIRARDEEVDLDVALKVIAANLLQADDERARFLKLVKTAKKLHHPNVVRIYDEGEQGATVFYTMPFLEGLTLRKIIDLRVERGQTFGFAEVLPIAAQLASAVDGWQKVGVHGALRPHNIVVLPDVLKVTGLIHQRGIPARPFLALHQQQRTNDYIAPEVRREEKDITAEADTYGVAVMLGEMLVGRLQSTDPTAWVEAASKLPTGVVDVLRKGASASPADRFPSGAALFQALAGAMSAASPDLAVPGMTSLPVFADDLFEDVIEPSTIADDPVELVPASLKDDTTGNGVPNPQPLEHVDTDVSLRPMTEASVSVPGSELPRKPVPHGPQEMSVSVVSGEALRAQVQRPSASKVGPGRPDVTNVEVLSGYGGRTVPGTMPLPDMRPRPAPAIDEPSSPGPQRVLGKPRVPIHNDTDRIAARPRASHQRTRRRASGVTGTVVVMALILGVGAAAAARWYGFPRPVAPEPVAPEPSIADTAAPPAVVEQAVAQAPEAPADTVAASPAVASAPVAAMNPVRRNEARIESQSTAEALRHVAALTATDGGMSSDPVPPPLPAPPRAPALTSPESDEPPLVHGRVSCPPGMTTIKAGRFVSGSEANDPMRAFGDESAHAQDTGGYCIDIYEYPNQHGRAPVTGYTWARAKKACESTGKRLCSEDEWERACKGPHGAKFPFGGGFEAGVCNVGEGGRPAASGEFARCRSGYGVLDLSGNVAEWTASRFGGDASAKVVKGGSVDQAAFTARCAARASESVNAHSDTLGFRCCADLD